MSVKNIFKKIKEHITPVDTSQQETEKINYKTFLLECALTNRVPALVILKMSLAMECLMVVIYFIQPYVAAQSKFFPQYIYMYISMILMSLCFVGLFGLYRKSPVRLMRLEIIMLAAVGVWSAVFSAFDVINGFSSYLFIQLMIVNSLLIRINPHVHCAINAVSFAVYYVYILAAGLSLTIKFAEFINPFFMLIVACGMIALINRTKYMAYLDQNKIKEQNKRLKYFADNDFLIKIPNRKSVVEYLDKVMSEDSGAIACMMIDIDDFKRYNDTYGHIMGDNCLIKIAAAIEKHVLENGGKTGRYGGEEFLAVFAGKNEDMVIPIAKELVSIIRDENIVFSASEGNKIVTISIGVCIAEKEGRYGRDELIACADQALYNAKKGGKNKISLYHPENIH